MSNRDLARHSSSGRPHSDARARSRSATRGRRCAGRETLLEIAEAHEELVQREQPSLVITDLMMPGIDGLELTRRLHADPRTAHIPVLMLTARGEVDDRVKGLETGVAAYLTKPFSPRELVTSARQLVKAEEKTAELVLSRRMESIELVAAGLAHEINNPLNYVKNALARVRLDAEQALVLAGEAAGRPLAEGERAQLERVASRVRELLGVADSGLKRIGGTVELMSRYGRGGFRRELVQLDVWDAVRTVIDVVVPATGRTGAGGPGAGARPCRSYTNCASAGPVRRTISRPHPRVPRRRIPRV